METVLEWLWRLSDALVQFLAQPFYYISIILIMLQYRRQVHLERKLFHVRLHSWGRQTWITLLGGLVAGVMVSLVSAFLGTTLTFNGVLLIWAVSIILLLFRVRYLCFAYSVGLLGVIQFILSWFPDFNLDGYGQEVLTAVRELDIPSLLALVALLHLAEAMLVRWQGAAFAGPLFYEGKRGKVVGGYQMKSFWPVPLFLLIPAQTTGSLLPWTPFFGGDAWQSGFSLIALPVVIGFSEMTVSALPKNKARLTSSRLLIYSIVILGLALLAGWWSPLTVVAALAAFVLHELLVWYSRFEEQNRSPFFVHPQRGLKVLAVLPGSPAEELGIQAGEVIFKVNGTPINTKEQLHSGLRMNPAFCKLEVLNQQGESKFLQRAIYAGDHHQLGVILAPDDDAPVALRLKPLSLLELLSPRRGASERKGSSKAAGGGTLDR
ncbi:PDZ domain-containing protein [Paenibacillus zeisoli]|uniref:PDZ domain-containing protein n=1 Tax=Paenibacillus zeisoli TaxID=2496267 RepID=A0A433XH10_9BACL|nr:PDZ domain-containing protein [Paenibacillus zeisoli]RUT33238.1 PDZ domain-containing protein [Paenibacillus zeisoli]